MTDLDEELAKQQSERLDDIYSAAAGQGFPGNPKDRKAVEDHAMKRAKAYFKQHFRDVCDVAAKESYDLHCEGPGKKTLNVEVKGTQGLGDAVFKRSGYSQEGGGVVHPPLSQNKTSARDWRGASGLLAVEAEPREADGHVVPIRLPQEQVVVEPGGPVRPVEVKKFGVERRVLAATTISPTP